MDPNVIVPLAVVALWMGVYPKPFLEFLHKPMGDLARTLQPAVFLAGGAQAAPPGTFPEQSETVTVTPAVPAPGAAAPPEREETVVVRPSPSPQP